MKNKRILVPFLIAVVTFILLGALYGHHEKVCTQCFDLKMFTPENIRHTILGFGSWAIVVYVLLYALNTVSLIPPIGIMSLTAGFVFGPLLGTAALMLGAFLGTSATFFISRYFGARFVDRLVKGKAKDFRDKLDRNGFKVILFIRLVPILPWEVVNYASGLSRISYRDYIWGTLLGIFPAVVIQTFFADRLSRFDITDPTLLIAVGAFVLLGAVPALYLKRKKRGTQQAGAGFREDSA